MNTNPQEPAAILRAGDTQILLYWEGVQPHRKLKAKISKLIPEEVLKVNPKAGQEWTIEELCAFGKLCEEACGFAIRNQSVDIRLAEEEPPPEEDDGAKEE